MGLAVALLILYALRANGHCVRGPRKPVIPSAASLRATATAAVAEFGTEVEVSPRAADAGSPPPSGRPGTAETAEVPTEQCATPTHAELAFEGECLICLVDLCVLEPDDRVVRLSCSHTFHRGCIVRWLSSPTQSGNAPRFQCPLCNHVVNSPLPHATKRAAAVAPAPGGT